ncbi:MAG: hypothetical protein ACI35P_04660 [Bacillus sp. (in: firmicutes)]
MTQIPEKDYDMIELVIYLPMVLTVLNHDLSIIENGHFKLKKPYIEWIQTSMNIIQQELSDIRHILRKENITVSQVKRDEAFTLFLFRHKGHEEYHNYFNPRIRNKVEELMKYYLCERVTSSTNRK